MPFPIIKLVTLAGKQISKPIANSIKRKVKGSPWFRDNVCVPLAQKYHRTTVTIRSKLLGIGKVQSIEPLSPEKAVDLMADAIGELVIFIVAVYAIYFESSRKSKNDEAKEQTQNNEIQSLKSKVEKLQLNAQRLEVSTQRLEETLRDLNTTIYYSQHGILSKILDSEETENKASERGKT